MWEQDPTSSTVGTLSCMVSRGVQEELVHSDAHQLGILLHASTETKITWEILQQKHIQLSPNPAAIATMSR